MYADDWASGRWRRFRCELEKDLELLRGSVKLLLRILMLTSNSVHDLVIIHIGESRQITSVFAGRSMILLSGQTLSKFLRAQWH